ncbi:YCF48-related protein [Marinobacter sp. NFXS9]|uniref:WD40/YVTN/BNR-like repeat-containing protein n=1 Tax=Marinobacter sp. NFXS9 TaxID=2818433 RepID=UPI0032E02768
MKSRIWITALIAVLVAALLGGLGYRAYMAAQEPQRTLAEQLRAGGPGVQDHLFFDVAHAGDVVIAVGDAGQVRRSADQGKTWATVATPTASTLTAVTFAGPKTAWAVGHQGTVLRSDDAGQTWQRVALSAELPEHFAAFDVLFTAPDTGFIVGSDGTLLTSSDGGSHWARDEVPYRASRDHLYSIQQLRSGAVAITTSGGALLRRSNDETEWHRENASWSGRPLYGVVEQADGTLLSFGADGGVFRRGPDDDRWDRVDATSKADFYSGRIEPDGTVVLAGSDGVIVRQAPQTEAFLVDPELDKGVVLAMDRLENGTLLLAGQSGLGRQTADGYRFQGQDAGTVGDFRRRQLMAMPMTRHLLDIGKPQPYWRRSRTPSSETGWLAWTLLMRSGDDDTTTEKDLLSPGVYEQVAGFQDELAEQLGVRSSRLQSVWSGSLEVRAMGGYYRRRLLNVSADPARYEALGDPERRALIRRLEQGGYLGLYIDPDHARASFVVDASDIDEPSADGKTVSLAKKVAAMPLDGKPFAIAGARRYTLREVAPVPEAKASETSPADSGAKPQPAIQAYTVTLDPDIRRCESQPVVAATMSLTGPLSDVKGTGAILSATAEASWIRAVEHEGSWKWFAPGATPRYGAPSFGHWGDDDCPRTLMIIYTQPGTGDLRPALKMAIEQTLTDSNTGLTAGDLVVKAYTLEQKPVPGGV